MAEKTIDLPPFFTVPELAKRWRCSTQYVRLEIERGHLGSPTRKGRGWIIDSAEVLKSEERDRYTPPALTPNPHAAA